MSEDYDLFRSILSTRVAELMDELEDYAGKPLEVKRRPGKPFMGTETRTDTAIIYIPNGPLSEHSACHELLHIRRYWIERVPRLVSADLRFGEFVGQINNQIEHVPIGKMEREYGFDPTAFWDELTRRNIDSAAWKLVDPSMNKAGLILDFLLADYLRPDTLAKLQAVTSEHKLKFLERTAAEARELAGPHKARAAEVIMKRLKWPPESWRLERLHK